MIKKSYIFPEVMQPEKLSKIAKTRAHYLALTPEKGLIFE